jgi:3-oxoacyl-[acyl-carrier protein] reductase
MKLEGKRVWVTGGTGAIGYAIVKRVKEEGALVCSSRIEITNLQEIEKVARMFRPDILVNCAGELGPVIPASYGNTDDWFSTIRVNLVAPYYLTRSLIPYMQANGGGKIIHFSGGGAAYGVANRSAYAASKAGLVRFVECVAEETQSINIQINAIAPGPVKSRMNPGIDGTPDKAVELTMFLASEESNHITGRLISAVHDDWKNEEIIKRLSKEAGKLRRIPLNG